MTGGEIGSKWLRPGASHQSASHGFIGEKGSVGGREPDDGVNAACIAASAMCANRVRRFDRAVDFLSPHGRYKPSRLPFNIGKLRIIKELYHI
jgi:hypothetical protein